MSAIELRLAFYGVLLAAIACGLLYERHAGEAQIRAEDKAAAAAQHARDTATNQEVVNGLKADNAHLADLAARPPPVVRVCVPTRVVFAGPAAKGTQPSVAPAGGAGDAGLPAGTTSIDIGPALSDVAWAQAVIVDYRDRTWQFAVNQAKGN